MSTKLKRLNINSALEKFKQNKYYYILPGISTRHLFSNEKVNIFLQEGISHSVRFWGEFELNESTLFITTLPWDHPHETFSSFAKIISETQPIGEKALNCFLICCNSHREFINARKAGFKRAILCNQNVFIDDEIFKIDENEKKIYSLVLNTRPEKWKRPYFAENIKDLAIIKGHNFHPNLYFDLNGLSPSFINENRLSCQEVCSVLNKSHVGGIFSEIEGACYSSSEFILSGLPVISTPCMGGREIYYNSDNHLIVNNPSEVQDALNELMERFKKHPELRNTIRKQHISLSSQMLKTLFAEVNKFMVECDCQISFGEIYKKSYKHKMIVYNHPSLKKLCNLQ
jgi:glycosyltransferase involved in cell wall biosynthesis